MQEYISFFLVVLSTQFLLFQHRHFNWFRRILCKNCVTGFLCHCSFCQCGWIGLATSFFLFDAVGAKSCVILSLSAAFVGVVVVTACEKLFKTI
jgi:hypothetical protein